MNRTVYLLTMMVAGSSGGALLAHWFKPPAALLPAVVQVPDRPVVRAVAGSGADAARAMAEELGLPPEGTGLGDQALWLTRLQKAGVEEMKQMLEEARKNPDPYERRIFREMVFVKWIRQDPMAAREYAMTYDEGRVKAQFVAYWARTDPHGAWAFYGENGSYAERQWTIIQIADQDPALYLEFMNDPARRQAARVNVDYTFNAVIRDGSRNNQAAAEQALAFPDKDHSSQMLDATCFLWAKKDPEAAMRWAESLTDKEMQRQAMFGVLRELANRDPSAATVQIDRMQGVIPNTLSVEIAAALTKKGLPEMEGYLSVYNKEGRFKVLLEGVLPAMEKPDTATVLPLLEKYWDSEHKVESGKMELGTFSRWVPDDAAAEWMKLTGFGESAARTGLAKILAPQLARTNPAAAIEAARQSGDPALKEMLASELARNSMKLGDEAGFLKAAALLEGKSLTNAVYGMTREVAENAPSMQEAFAFASRQQGEVKTRAEEMVAWVWAERDPVQAMNWAVSGEAGLRADLKTEMAQRWAKDDSYAVSAWLDQQPVGPGRDDFTYGLLRSIADAEPDSAFAWSQSLSDPARRTEWAAWSLKKWAKRDAAAAWQAVESTSFDENSRTVLRQALTIPSAP